MSQRTESKARSSAMDSDIVEKLSKELVSKGYKDEKLNKFKLEIYENNMEDVIKCYEYDQFCHHFMIYSTCKFGNDCKLGHKYSIGDLILEREYLSQAKLYTNYLIYYCENVRHASSNPMTMAWLYNHLGHIYEKENNFDKAKENYLRSLECCPNSATCHCQYGLFLANKMRDNKDAEYHLTQGLNLNPNGYRCYILARFLQQNNKFEESIPIYKRAISFKPNHLRYVCDLAYCLYSSHNCNHYVECIDTCYKALKLMKLQPCLSREKSIKQENVKQALFFWLDELKPKVKEMSQMPQMPSMPATPQMSATPYSINLKNENHNDSFDNWDNCSFYKNENDESKNENNLFYNNNNNRNGNKESKESRENKENNNNNNNIENLEMEDKEGQKNDRFDIRRLEFDRFWKSISIPEKSKSKYYLNLNKFDYNFITLLGQLNYQHLTKEIEMNHIHCDYVIKRIEKWEKDRRVFCEWLKQYKWFDEYNITFENNGILTFESFYFHIHNPKTLKEILAQDYNATYIAKDVKKMWDKLPRTVRLRQDE